MEVMNELHSTITYSNWLSCSVFGDEIWNRWLKSRLRCGFLMRISVQLAAHTTSVREHGH
jgi:hypothetical protein